MKTNNITPELIRAALLHISANLSRDEWARIDMPIKSEFPDATGRTLFLDWSATADSFDGKAAQATWKSIKASGGVSIATLLHQAQGSGFTLPKDNQARSELDPETAARLARERAASQQVEQAQQRVLGYRPNATSQTQPHAFMNSALNVVRLIPVGLTRPTPMAA